MNNVSWSKRRKEENTFTVAYTIAWMTKQFGIYAWWIIDNGKQLLLYFRNIVSRLDGGKSHEKHWRTSIYIETDRIKEIQDGHLNGEVSSSYGNAQSLLLYAYTIFWDTVYHYSRRLCKLIEKWKWLLSCKYHLEVPPSPCKHVQIRNIPIHVQRHHSH